MKISARNVFKGKVKTTLAGPVSTEVTIRIAPGVNVVAVISTNSAKSLKLRPGKKAYAIIKATSVMVGTD